MVEEKILACLERLAYNTAHSPLDFKDYLEQVVYAKIGIAPKKKKEGDKK